jgi:hypothetical protein
MKIRSRTKLYQFLFFVLLAGIGASVFGQTGSSTLLGTVTDPTGAVVLGATLTATEQSTAAVRTASSNQAGMFRILDLQRGQYSLRVEAVGFKAFEMKDITLASSESRDLGKLVLELGAVTEAIAVTAQATPVQTGSSERSALIDNHQLNQVALKGRDPFGFMRLIPGIVDTTTDRSLAGYSSALNIYVNGMATGSKNITFDGVTELDQGGSNSMYVSPNMDALAEMKVVSNAYQAEYGRTAGAGVNLVTKSGSTDFHGTGFWNHRNEGMNANTFFNNHQNIQRPIYRYFVGAIALEVQSSFRASSTETGGSCSSFFPRNSRGLPSPRPLSRPTCRPPRNATATSPTR